MRAHVSTIIPRMRKASYRVHGCRFRVVAVGVDRRGNIIGLATNRPRLKTRGWHAEEVLIHRVPRSLSVILIARFGRTGELLPIDPCPLCAELAKKRGISIRRVET